MRLLFVTTNDYPFHGTCSNLINMVILESGLIHKVDKVTVVSGKSSFFDDTYDTYQGINIFRANTWSLYKKEELKRVFLCRKLEAIIGLIIKLIKYTETHFLWFRFFDTCLSSSLYKALKKTNARDADIIIAVSGRYEATEAALKYAQKYRKPLIIYQVDPCATNLALSKKSYKQRLKFEKKVFSYASSIITMPIIYNDLQLYLDKLLLQKINVADLPLIIRPKYDNKRCLNNKIVCLFAGSIYGGIRNPEYTLRIFEKIVNEEIEFHMVGVNVEQIPQKYRRYVKCYGIVSNEEARRLIQEEADILINIGNRNINQVPSKIFEYMSTGKPIINICKSINCSTIEYFSRYPLAINVFEEEKDVLTKSQEIVSFIRKNKDNRVPFEVVASSLEKNTPKYVSQQLLQIAINIKNQEEI